VARPQRCPRDNEPTAAIWHAQRGRYRFALAWHKIRPWAGFVENARQLRETEMDQMEIYKGFRIRAYQEWRGQWFAEARKSTMEAPETDWIATPSGHPTPQAAIAVIKQMIDSPSTTIEAPKTIQ
jgi:hypothetical protein